MPAWIEVSFLRSPSCEAWYFDSNQRECGKGGRRGGYEVGSVVDGGLVGWCAAEDAGFPGVEVGVKVDYGDGTVGGVHAAEDGEDDGVVAAEGDDARQGFMAFGGAWGMRVCEGGAGEEGVVAALDLGYGVFVVVAEE